MNGDYVEIVQIRTKLVQYVSVCRHETNGIAMFHTFVIDKALIFTVHSAPTGHISVHLRYSHVFDAAVGPAFVRPIGFSPRQQWNRKSMRVIHCLPHSSQPVFTCEIIQHVCVFTRTELHLNKQYNHNVAMHLKTSALILVILAATGRDFPAALLFLVECQRMPRLPRNCTTSRPLFGHLPKSSQMPQFANVTSQPPSQFVNASHGPLSANLTHQAWSPTFNNASMIAFTNQPWNQVMNASSIWMTAAPGNFSGPVWNSTGLTGGIWAPNVTVTIAGEEETVLKRRTSRMPRRSTMATVMRFG